MLKYQWQGNVRELENAIERAMVLTEQPILTLDNFPIEFGEKASNDDKNAIFEGHSLKIAQKILEKILITKALTTTNGNRTQASKLLEISHPSLLSKIKEHEIDL